MKYFIALSIALFTLSSHAGIGDTYSTPAKVGRYSWQAGLFEVVGLAVLADHDGDPDTARISVKAAVDANYYGAAADMGMDPEFLSIYMDASAIDKLLVGVVYNLDNVVKTSECLGRDFIYTHPDGGEPTKTCYMVTPTDLVLR